MATPTLPTERALDLLEMLAVDLRRSPSGQRLLQALANELDRIEGFMYAFLEASFPQNATDELNTLSIWEVQLGLPVAPEGLSEDQRRQSLLAKLAARHADEGQDWVAAATAIIGPGWSYQENYPAADQLTVLIPYPPGSPEAGRVETQLRAITPAHLDLIVTFGGGFLVGLSEVGEDAI